ncbi:MAG: hypothetical protein WB930_01745 [Syntrophobacteraceae bacterium]
MLEFGRNNAAICVQHPDRIFASYYARKNFLNNLQARTTIQFGTVHDEIILEVSERLAGEAIVIL